MKKNILGTIICCTLSFTSTYSQTKTGAQYLDVNDISVPITPGNLIMFWDDSLQSNYNYPKENPKILLFSSSLWFGAKSQDTTFVSAQLYGQNGFDYHAGPLDTTSAFSDSASQAQYNRIWKINRAEIEEFKERRGKPGYSIPNIILDWPAHGTGKHAQNLAPFVDVNNDGLYNPHDGDYPQIRGDQMLYWIVNDRTQLSETGIGRESTGIPLGLEIHGSAYAFQCNEITNDSTEILNRTTFYHFDIVNRSHRNYDSFVLGVFTDPDLGNFSNDFIGSYLTHDLGFAYNGEDDDSGPGGFGENKNRLACGTQFLSHPMDYIISFNNDPGPKHGNPNTPRAFYNYLKGNYKNGESMQVKDSNGIIINPDFNWFYPFDSLMPGQKPWLKNGIPLNGTISPSDKRYIQSTHIGQVASGGSISFDYAILFGELALDSKIALTKTAPLVKSWYANNQFPSCLDGDQLLSIPSSVAGPVDDLKVYPNPNTGRFTIALGKSLLGGELQILNAAGKVVSQSPVNSSKVVIRNLDLAQGLYLVRIKSNKGSKQVKVVVR